MLKFRGAWRFESPGRVDYEVREEFHRLIGKVAAQGDQKAVFEHFKTYFAKAAGTTSSSSSSVSWAESDLLTYISEAASNAPLFIEAFYDACEDLRDVFEDIAVPSVTVINEVLSKHDTGYRIQLPDLISSRTAPMVIPVSETAASLDDQAIELVEKSLSRSEKFLSQGDARQAVQEILWLLETVTTVFRGTKIGKASIQGKYFNKIIKELRQSHKGTAFEQVSEWMMALHGYLSSPTGGGVRHGMDLKDGVVTEQHEARLFCNLIRSYISFLMTEYDRLAGHR